MNMSKLQVQAAVFASSCFCNISEHFAILAVGHIHDLIVAKETILDSRIQAISVFAHMSSSIVAALKAHETAKALMESMTVEELLATIEALSKLALECSILVSAQVELLLSYVRSCCHTVVRALSLECLIKLVKKAAGNTGIDETAYEAFYSIFECADESPYMKKLALQGLRKLFPFHVLVFHADSLMRLLSLIKSKSSEHIWSEGQPALGFLVDIVCTLGKLRPDLLKLADAQLGLEYRAAAFDKKEEPIYGSELSTLAVSLICDLIVQLGCAWSIEGLTNGRAGDISMEGRALGVVELKRRLLCLGGLLVQLARHSSRCGFVVVCSLAGLVETLLTNIQQGERGEFQQEPGHFAMAEMQMTNARGESAARSYVLKTLCQCIKDCSVFWLSQEGPSNTAFLQMTQLVAWITSMSIPPYILIDCCGLIAGVRKYLSSKEAKAIADKINVAVASFIQEKDFWAAYKTLAVAACHCLWNNSASAIEQFMHKAQSESTFYWLKAFAALCVFEENLESQCSLQAIQCCVDGLESKVMTHSHTSANLGQAIARALSSSYTAENSLAAAVKLDRRFEFQRCMVSLRVAFIRTSGELLGLLAPICAQIQAIDMEALASSVSPTENDSVKLLISSIRLIGRKAAMLCTRFKRLAVAFDVLRMSTMGIDKESANILSFASLGCSFFSFCAVCALFTPQLLASGSDLNLPLQSLAASIANDLYLRLCTSSGHGCTELLNFVLQLGGAYGSPIISKGGLWAYDVKETHAFIICAVQKVLNLQEKTSIRNPDLSWVILARGVHLCRYSVERWLNFPWALPKHFLNTKPPLGMDVFVELTTDASSRNEISIAQGNLAPLSMCFQLRNLEIYSNFEVRSLGCALVLKSNETERDELHTSWNLDGSGEKLVCFENDLHLLDRLMRNVSLFKGMMWGDLDERADRDLPPIVLCDVNEKGQGFASCVYDTSGLECGVYHISVLAMCLDNDHHCWIVPPVLREGPSITITPS